MLKELDKTDYTSANGVEREFHSISDHRRTSDDLEKSTEGPRATSKSPDNVKGHTRTEDNKFDRTVKSKETAKDTLCTEAVESTIKHL